MGRSIVTNIRAVPDAVDRILWEVDIATDFFGTRHQLAYALFWEGVAVFYREALPAGSGPGPQTPRMQLPARWLSRTTSARMLVPDNRRFEFATDLPGDALERIDRFREGGRLFARIEGKLTVVMADASAPTDDLIRAMLFDLGKTMLDSGRVQASICTDPKELSRDTWQDEILAKLRPEGRHVLEVTVPIGSAAGDESAAVLQHQRAAQRFFDDGRYEEAVRECALALEQTKALLDKVEARYGKLSRERVAEQIRATKSLYDTARHAQKGQTDAARADRALAHHVLIVTSSLLALATS